jgi:molecular chaperone HtpG
MSGASSSPTRRRSCRRGCGSCAASIDSEDLPLNLSREMLQKNPVLEAIRRGCHDAHPLRPREARRDDRSASRRYLGGLRPGSEGRPLRGAPNGATRSTRSPASAPARRRRRLGAASPRYIAALRENQTAIYYRSATMPRRSRRSPQLEGYARRGVEVLILSDPVDAFWVRTALGYDGKPFQSVTQGPPSSTRSRSPMAAEDAEAAPESAVATLVALLQADGSATSVSACAPRPGSPTSPVCLVAPGVRPRPAVREVPLANDQLAGVHGRRCSSSTPRIGSIKALAERARAASAGEAVDDAAVLLYARPASSTASCPRIRPTSPAARPAHRARIAVGRGAMTRGASTPSSRGSRTANAAGRIAVA